MQPSLSNQAFNEVRTWIYRNARPLETALWRFHFEDGKAEDALRILALYQNADGGFAHALEPDNWTVCSSPYTTNYALQIILRMGNPLAAQAMASRAMDYLAAFPSHDGDLWPFTVPGGEDAPHAPWWNYDPRDNGGEGMGMSVAIAATALRLSKAGTPLYQRAMRVAGRALSGMSGGSEMGTAGLCALLEALQAIDPARVQNALASVKVRVNADIMREPAQWPNHTHRPSEFIFSPDSPYYAGNEGILESEIAFTLSERAPGGVWPITWTWFDNQPRFEHPFAISENWWKATVAMERIGFLKAFGRLDI